VAPPTRRERTSTRSHIVQRLVEHANGFALHFFLNDVEGAVDDGSAADFLAVDHDVVHELGQIAIAEFRVRVESRAFLRGDDVT
jgi:hypothetical protein